MVRALSRANAGLCGPRSGSGVMGLDVVPLLEPRLDGVVAPVIIGPWSFVSASRAPRGPSENKLHL